MSDAKKRIAEIKRRVNGAPGYRSKDAKADCAWLLTRSQRAEELLRVAEWKFDADPNGPDTYVCLSGCRRIVTYTWANNVRRENWTQSHDDGCELAAFLEGADDER